MQNGLARLSYAKLTTTFHQIRYGKKSYLWSGAMFGGSKPAVRM